MFLLIGCNKVKRIFGLLRMQSLTNRENYLYQVSISFSYHISSFMNTLALFIKDRVFWY